MASLAAAAGIGGMAGGQMLDLAGEHGTPNESDIRRMQAMKTGALFRHAAEAGAILGRANTTERASLAAFGAALGLAFQLADDLIDATGAAGAAGKATAKDAARGKQTLVAIHGVSGAVALLDAAVAEAQRILRPFGSRADMLREAARFVAMRE
jgi:farnesyl diphosphate synthase